MKTQIPVRILSCAAIIFLAACSAALPPRGSPEWTRRVEKGEILVESLPIPGTDLELATGIGRIDAPPALVWESLENADDWSQFLYNVSESKELVPEGQERRFLFTVDPPAEARAAGFGKIRMKCRATRTQDAAAGAWKAEFEATEGNMKRVYGAWKVEPWRENQTLLTFSVFLDLGYSKAFDGVINFYTRGFIERWGGNIRSRLQNPTVRSGLEWRAVRRREGK